jgi:hypothetical protein
MDMPSFCAGYGVVHLSAALVQLQRRAKSGVVAAPSSSGKDCVPNSRRGGTFEAHVREIELTFANAMHQFDAGDRSGCISEAFEAEHCIDPGLDVAMILLDQVVQILRRSQSRLLRQRLVSLHFAHCAMRRRVTVQCDGFRSEPLTLDRLREEGLRCGNIALGAEPEVDRLSRSINGTAEIDPFATDLHIRLVDSADLANRSHRLTNAA